MIEDKNTMTEAKKLAGLLQKLMEEKGQGCANTIIGRGTVTVRYLD